MPGPYGATEDETAVKRRLCGGVKTPPYKAACKRMLAERGRGGRQPSPSAAVEADTIKIAPRSPPRGFGGTPEFKVEQGPRALRTKSNTAFV